MKETYIAGCYWTVRPESLEVSAQRAATFFQLLSRCDPVFARWFEQADSQRQALKLQFEPTLETFLRFFKKKRYQDLGGYDFGAWTGHKEGHGSMVLLCTGLDSELLTNSCVIWLPSDEPEYSHVLTPSVLAEVMRALTLAWEPEWGVVVSDQLRSKLTKKPAEETFVGWLTYLSRYRGTVPPLPAPARIEPVEDRGTLITLSPERLSGSNPEHVALAERTQARLRKAGLLEPLKPWNELVAGPRS